MDPKVRQVILDLYGANGIKTEPTKLKTGVMSPIYVNMRVVLEDNKLEQGVIDLLASKVIEIREKYHFDIVGGVPYGGYGLVASLRGQHRSLNLRQLLLRKEGKKSYGVKEEGQQGYTVLLVEDTLTSGTSILETLTEIRKSGMKVTDVIVLIDRQQQGVQNLERLTGVRIHCLLGLDTVLNVLVEEGKIAKATKENIIQWIQEHPSKLSPFAADQYRIVEENIIGGRRLPFEKRAQIAHQKARNLNMHLFKCINSKKSNVCLAVDISSPLKILELADQLGQYICMLKLHWDIIDQFSEEEFIKPLKLLSEKHNFLIFADRKFADIGHTVSLQYSRLLSWANVVTAHVFPGPGVITGLKKGLEDSHIRDMKNSCVDGAYKNVLQMVNEENNPRGCFLLAEMSSEGNLLGQKTVEFSYQLANGHSDFVAGFICQSRITTDPTLVHLTPGVSLSGGSGDSLGQHYKSPRDAILNGADIVIVGRNVTSSSDPVGTIKTIVDESFSTYMSLVENNDINGN